MESKLMRGDPDGTRKRPAHSCVNSLSSCVVADQRLTDADRRITARESTRLDRKLDTAWKLFVTACAIATLWGAANLAKAEDIAYHWKISAKINLSESVTVSSLTLYADPTKIGQPYFPVYGGVTEKVGDITVWNDPIGGSCRVSKGVNYVCEIGNSSVELRLTKLAGAGWTVYAGSGSRMGAQGPFGMEPVR